MNTYEVIAENLAGHKLGDIVTADQLNGANIEALVESGHIKPTNPKKDK